VLVGQLEVPLETVYAAIACGVRHGLQVVVNPAPAAPLDLAALRGVAYLVPNQTELELLSGLSVKTRDDAAIAARALIAGGIKRVIVTLGADGALLVDGAREHHVAGIAVDAIDTTGAGDAFIGCFINELAGGASTLTAIEASVRYAAHSVTRRGTQSSYGSRDDFDAFLTK
jgi:ribokinase